MRYQAPLLVRTASGRLRDPADHKAPLAENGTSCPGTRQISRPVKYSVCIPICYSTIQCLPCACLIQEWAYSHSPVHSQLPHTLCTVIALRPVLLMLRYVHGERARGMPPHAQIHHVLLPNESTNTSSTPCYRCHIDKPCIQ